MKRTCNNPNCQLADLGPHKPSTSCQMLEFHDACKAARLAIAEALAPIATRLAMLAGFDGDK